MIRIVCQDSHIQHNTWFQNTYLPDRWQELISIVSTVLQSTDALQILPVTSPALPSLKGTLSLNHEAIVKGEMVMTSRRFKVPELVLPQMNAIESCFHRSLELLDSSTGYQNMSRTLDQLLLYMAMAEDYLTTPSQISSSSPFDFGEGSMEPLIENKRLVLFIQSTMSSTGGLAVVGSTPAKTRIDINWPRLDFLAETILVIRAHVRDLQVKLSSF